MANLTKRRVGELLRGVFKILRNEEDPVPAKEVLRRVEALVPPTEFELSSYPSKPNSCRYPKIVRFATIAPVKAGWLIKNKGAWSLTEEGKRAYDSIQDPEQFRIQTVRLYRQWKAEQNDEVGNQADEAEDASSASIATLEEAEEAAWDEISAYMDRMPPFDFQDLVAGLLRGMGYFVEWVSPPGKDDGRDIVAHADPLGVDGARIVVQVKRRGDRAAVEAVRGFMALLGDTDVGIFVCTGGFTKDAESEVRRQERKRIMLLDAKRVFELWVQHYAKVPDEQRRLLPIRPVHYLDLDD